MPALTCSSLRTLFIWIVILEEATQEITLVVHTVLEWNWDDGVDYVFRSCHVIGSIELPLKK